MIQDKFIQFELWKNCNNKCTFCEHLFDPVSDDNQKIIDLQYFISELQQPFIDQYNVIGFIGGEIFDNQINNQNVKRYFYQLFNICAEKKIRGKLKKIYIATSLIYNIDKYLIPFIHYLSKLDLLDITYFCTSYDLKYRFHTDYHHQLWCNNVLELNKQLINKIHVEIILTQTLINAVLNNTFDISHFYNKYNVDIDFIEPSFISKLETKENTSTYILDFFPTRTSFLKFLKYVHDYNIIDLDMFLSMKLRSDALYFRISKTNKLIKVINRVNNNLRKYDVNGNPVNIQSYIDSDCLMYNDVQAFRSII